MPCISAETIARPWGNDNTINKTDKMAASECNLEPCDRKLFALRSNFPAWARNSEGLSPHWCCCHLQQRANVALSFLHRINVCVLLHLDTMVTEYFMRVNTKILYLSAHIYVLRFELGYFSKHRREST